MELKLTFGLNRKGELLEISEVEKGLECGCFCPACHLPLIAKKGSVNAHHFAHYNSPECSKGLETALHLAAKEILERNKKILLPPVLAFAGIKYQGGIILFNEQLLEFEKVSLETKIDNIIPDLIVEKNGKKLFIEIAVTHFIDEEKKKKIQKLNISTLEIDLSKVNRQLDIAFLEKILLEKTENKKWIYNTKNEEFNSKIIECTRLHGNEYEIHTEKISKSRYVLPPNGETHLKLNCYNCNFMAAEITSNLDGKDYIICMENCTSEIDRLVKIFNKKNE